MNAITLADCTMSQAANNQHVLETTVELSQLIDGPLTDIPYMSIPAILKIRKHHHDRSSDCEDLFAVRSAQTSSSIARENIQAPARTCHRQCQTTS